MRDLAVTVRSATFAENSVTTKHIFCYLHYKLYAYEKDYANSEINIGYRADVYDVSVRSSAKRLAD